MKQKLLTILALLLTICSGAWAQTTLISYTVSDSDNSGTSGSDWTNAAGTVTGTPGGTCQFRLDGSKCYTNGTSYRIGGGNGSISLTLSGENTFQAGDVVSVTLQCGSATGVYVRTGYKTTTNQIASTDITGSANYETVTATLNANFELNTIYIERKSPTIYVSSVTVTRPVTYSVTALSSNNSHGTVSAGASVLQQGETTTITATPATGYKVASWSVEGTGASISPSGESNSLTTTLTMGTAAATVTCTFAAATTYTISYDAGSATGVTGSRDDESKTADVAFSLPSTRVFSRSGYLQTGWNTAADGTSGTHYDLGGSYTTNAAQTFYPEWTALDYTFVPTGEVSSTSLSNGDVVATSTGGVMTFTPIDANTSATLKYASNNDVNGLEFGGNGNCAVTVTLNKKMQAGTVINFSMYVGTASARGLILCTFAGTNVATFTESVIGTYDKTYTVTAGDGLEGSNVFMLKRNNNAYLNSLYVFNSGDATETITPGKEYTTYCSTSALNFTGVEGLTAYVVSAAENGSATLTPVTDVPASTGLILQGTAGTTYYVPVGSATTLGTTNKLVGVTSATEVAAWTEGSVYNYVLSDGQFHRASAGTLAAGKAYLHVDANPEGSNARSLSIIFEDEDVTSIDASIVNSEKSMVNSYYDLQGRKVAQPARGLYIVNGKKVVVK